jgi:hypothetical protein
MLFPFKKIISFVIGSKKQPSSSGKLLPCFRSLESATGNVAEK